MSRLIVVLLLAVPSLCIAQDEHYKISMQGWYAGGAFGQAKVDDWCDDVPRVTSVALISCDKRDDYFKAYLGYQVLPIFSIEGGYHYLGKYKISGTNGANSASGTADGSAATLRAVVNFYAAPFSAFVAGGIARWDIKVAAKTNSTTLISVRDSGYSLQWGIGGGFDLNKWWSVQVEYEQFNDVGEDATTGQSDVKAIGLGLRYRF